MEKIIGLIDAPFTPFDKDGNVNLQPIPEYCALLVRSGLKGVFINGSSGEGYMLSEEERMQIAEEWAAPSLPFYYYHIPVFNGAYLSMLDLLKAVDGRIPNFAGIKYTYEALYEYNQCMLYKDGKYDMLHGQDETILSALVMGGAQGGIGGTTNYNALVLNGIIEAWKAGDIAKARELQNYAQAVINVIAKYRGNICAGKRIMKLIGLDLGPNRKPFMNITDAEEAQIKAELEAIDFFNHCNK